MKTDGYVRGRVSPRISSAEAGCSYGELNLGECYFLGTGVKKDEAEAVKWHRKVAAQGLIEAKDKLRKLGK